MENKRQKVRKLKDQSRMSVFAKTRTFSKTEGHELPDWKGLLSAQHNEWKKAHPRTYYEYVRIWVIKIRFEALPWGLVRMVGVEQVPYKELKNKVITNFSTPALEARPMEHCFLGENYFLLSILYSAKLQVKHEDRRKTFSDMLVFENFAYMCPFLWSYWRMCPIKTRSLTKQQSKNNKKGGIRSRKKRVKRW